jgi:hypothetical protein
MIPSCLRTIGAILWTTPGFDTEQGTHLHLGGVIIFAMYGCSLVNQLHHGHFIYRPDFIAGPICADFSHENKIWVKLRNIGEGKDRGRAENESEEGRGVSINKKSPWIKILTQGFPDERDKILLKCLIFMLFFNYWANHRGRYLTLALKVK